MQSTTAINQKAMTELVTFYMGKSLCGIDITDIQEINNYNVFMTPALVINDIVKSTGKVASPEQIKKWLSEA